jgi:hypothetical protein
VLEPPRPKSPPRYPDLCGRRRLQLELQILNREVDFLKVSVPGRGRVPLLRPQTPLGGRTPPCVSHLTWPPLNSFEKSPPVGSDSSRDLFFFFLSGCQRVERASTSTSAGGNAVVNGQVGAKSDRWSTPFISPSFGDGSLMWREKERRAADPGGSAVNPRRDRLALFGRAAAVPLGPCGSVPWERRGEGGRHGHGQWPVALALAVSVLRVEQWVGLSPFASLPVLASRTRTRHGSSGSGTIMRVPAELPYCMHCTGAYGLGCHSLGLFMCWTRVCVFLKGNEGLFDAVLRFQGADLRRCSDG